MGVRAVFFIALLLPFTILAEPNYADGKLLFEESCEKCHRTPYQGLGWNDMLNLVELRHMIGACSDHFHLDWNKQDIDDALHYMNSEFFQLEK